MYHNKYSPPTSLAHNIDNPELQCDPLTMAEEGNDDGCDGEMNLIGEPSIHSDSDKCGIGGNDDNDNDSGSELEEDGTDSDVGSDEEIYDGDNNDASDNKLERPGFKF